jgi:peptide/nickel transport system permease protein
MSRLIFGTRVSLMAGFLSTTIGGMIGIAMGILAGYRGGWIDIAIGRIIDILLAFPGMLLALAIAAMLGPSTRNVIIAISIFAIPSFARIARGSTLNVKKLEYVDAIKAIGASDFRVMFVHIFPNIWSTLIVQATLFVASAIMISAALSFLGIGTQPPTPEWGTMLANGREFLARAPHLVIIPGIAITVVVIAISMLGDGLRNALEPKD